MAAIVLRQRARKQPQIAVGLDRGHKLFPYLVFGWSAGRGLQDGRHPNSLGSNVGTIRNTVAAYGRAAMPADSSSYIQFGDIADYNPLGNITIVARIRSAGTTIQQGILTKCETGGGTNTPFALLTEIGGAISLNRSNSGFRVWSSAATITAGSSYVVAVSQGADMSVAPKFYLNGIKDSGAATSLYGGSGAGAAASNTTSLKIGNRTDLLSQCFHDVHDAFIFNDVLSDSAIRALTYELDYLWQAPQRKLWAVSSTPSSDAVGSSSGLTAVSGVGASVAESTGSSSGLATVTGVSDFTSSSGSTGSAAGSSTVSGVGASVAASAGSASGLATVSGVGNSATAGASTGSSTGSSTVNGVSASIAASVGSASGESVVTGRTPIVAIEAEFSGGFPWIDHDDRKKKQRAKLGIVKEVEHVLKSSNNKDLEAKRPVKGTSPQERLLAQQEALNAELRRLVQIEAQLELEREEEAIVRMLMEM